MAELRHIGSNSRTLSDKVQVAELAARQWGVVARRQLVEIGVSRADLVRWVRERRLVRLYPGVYAVGHPALSLEGRLAGALFYAGKGAALCNTTAASWCRMLPGEPRRIHVCVPGRRRSPRTVRVHCRRRVERTIHRGLPVTPPAQTLLDIAPVVGFQELRRALSEAEYLKLVTLDEVGAVLGRGKPGSAALREALDLHTPLLARTKRGTEEEFLQLCERYPVTPPDDVNVRIARWKVDAVWHEQKVVVELDSQLAHGTPARLEADHQRDLELRAAGYIVLRYTWQQVTRTPELVVADLRRHGLGRP